MDFREFDARYLSSLNPQQRTAVLTVEGPVLLLATQILMFIGIFDQISNFRGLRKPPEPKEDMDL